MGSRASPRLKGWGEEPKARRPLLPSLLSIGTPAAQMLLFDRPPGEFGYFKNFYARYAILLPRRTNYITDEMVARLLKVEHADEATEIVIHVKCSRKVGRHHLYTSFFNAQPMQRTPIEQSIGRDCEVVYQACEILVNDTQLLEDLVSSHCHKLLFVQL